MNDLTRDEVAALLSYCPESGSFTWRVDLRGGVKAGDVAGTESNGYRQIGLKGVRYYAHRLAFLLMTGAWPSQQVDHRNGVKSDNRWENLRDVSNTANQQNLRKPGQNNTTGLLGVSRASGGRFLAMIVVDGQKKFLGRYDCPHVAHAVYLAHKRLMHEGCTL